MEEIEYKFLVDKIPITKDKIYITQHYIQDKKMFDFACLLLKLDDRQAKTIDTVRVRQSVTFDNEIFTLTLKTAGNYKRDEYEIQIPKDIAYKFIKHSSKVIKKIRQKIAIDDLVFEFDFYYERADKLKICEIEVKNTQKYNKILYIFENFFKIKAIDVTNNKNYKNFNLARSEKNERNF